MQRKIGDVGGLKESDIVEQAVACLSLLCFPICEMRSARKTEWTSYKSLENLCPLCQPTVLNSPRFLKAM